MWIKRLLFSALAAAFLLPAPSQAQERRQITIGISQFPSTFHPSIDAMMAKSYILGLTRRPLTVYDADWTLICMLCVELPTLENGQAVLTELEDGRQGVALTYRLLPEAVWGDGTPITSADAVFTWEVGRHPQSGVSNAELYRRITEVEVVDDKTFILHVDRLTFAYNAINDFNLLPAHVEREAFADPAAYRQRSLYDADPTNPALSAGPYRITEMRHGSHVVLERNPHWWGEQAAFERIIVRAIENTQALEANLLSGQVDMIAGESGLPIDQVLAFEQRHGQRFQIHYQPNLSYEHVDFNLSDPILSQLPVRQALLYALDREALVQQLFQGRQQVAHGTVHPLDWVHAEDVPVYEYDARRAGELLDEAGFRPGPGGIRRDAEGRPLSLTFMSTGGNRTRELVQQVLQAQWRQIGVDVRINNEPPRVLFGETLTRRRFPHMVMFAWISSPENVPRTTLHSESIPSEENGWAGQNYGGYANEEMDRLIGEIEVELDREARREKWRRLQHLYAETLPALPLFFRSDAHIMPLWLEGVRPTGHQYPATLWVEEWRVRS
ncbi:peptide ABC transporter substrate-binding protein [Telmatospirillum sp. J64-1]|uniref:peptide ABC transporter substrate-binding protein n=1 Tax=Telmatospirillum sp. J64-1 TaxID=2502183 RepID=UPI00115DE7D4|nr:peptide ABC transporter substrate-binding protein [Telmatospirillum sp. J64-1]